MRCKQAPGLAPPASPWTSQSPGPGPIPAADKYPPFPQPPTATEQHHLKSKVKGAMKDQQHSPPLLIVAEQALHFSPAPPIPRSWTCQVHLPHRNAACLRGQLRQSTACQHNAQVMSTQCAGHVNTKCRSCRHNAQVMLTQCTLCMQRVCKLYDDVKQNT